jgi:pantoate--beta-alanine ligase
MEIITDPILMQKKALDLKRQGWVVGLVPTMGCLHEGHLSLIRIAHKKADCVVTSLFVNPLQFGPHEDFDQYPRDPERDHKLAEEAGTDILFAPNRGDVYAEDQSVTLTENLITPEYEGVHREGHFDGVLTVVGKLFNLVLPDLAVFGRKDAQQLAVIRRMVRDLNYPIEIVEGRIVREEDGLAMSSRNVYLSESQRKEAVWLNQSLENAEQRVQDGERDMEAIRSGIQEDVETNTSGVIDYIGLVDPDTFQPITEFRRPLLAVMTVRFGETRLLDNQLL